MLRNSKKLILAILLSLSFNIAHAQTLSGILGSGGGSGSCPGSSTDTQVLFNSSGTCAGSGNLTFDGTGLTTGYLNVTSNTIPTLGIFTQAANELTFATNGTSRIALTTSGFLDRIHTGGFALVLSSNSSSGTPTIIPNRGSITTGLGGDGSNLYLIKNGTNVVSIDNGNLSVTGAANTTGLVVGNGSVTGSNTTTLGLSVTGTLNTTGTVDGAVLFANITDTASASGSLLMDLQVGGISKFSVSKTGILTIGPTLNFASNTSLITPATDQLEQRRSTNAQSFRVYNTYTDASNYERGVFDWSTTANTLSIGTTSSGTGQNRNIQFLTNGGTALTLSTSSVQIGNRHLTWGTDNTYDIGSSSGNRPRNLYIGNTVVLRGFTVSTLPASPTQGATAFITDQTTTCAVPGGVLTGGGSVVCPVFYNGTAWVGG